MTFGDGTFPVYEILYYNGGSMGLIQNAGLFYLGQDTSGNNTVIFPDFYGYHTNQDVIYTASTQLLATIAGTNWKAEDDGQIMTFAGIGNSVTFSGGSLSLTTTYVYNGYQAGGINDGIGSFEVDPDGTSLSILFYNFNGSGTSKTFSRTP
jgi:hypothetical protein